MDQVKVSPKFQVVIPKHIREAMDLRAGQKMQVLQYDSQIVLVPVRKMDSMRGFARGIDTDVKREPDRF